MRPAPVRCWFTGRAPALRLPRPGALPLLMRYMRPWFLRVNRNHQALGLVQARSYKVITQDRITQANR
jgi:hypothetical protein